MRPTAVDFASGADHLMGLDFPTHNAEVEQVWQAYRRGQPTRTPIIVGTNTRYFMFNHQANPQGITFKQYSEDPAVMFEMQLRFQRWLRFNVLQDAALGLPPRWSIGVDFQNYYEAAWFGCPIRYFDGQVPDTQPVFADCPERILAGGLPDPFGGVMARAWRYYEYFRQRAAHETFLDRPIDVAMTGLGTDGVMTVACNLFGADFVCTAMVEEPERLHRLFEFITQATIARIQAFRQRLGLPMKPPDFGFADDSIALISTPMYRQHVLPHHRRLCQELAGPGPRAIHLCGDATRHFVTIRDALNVQTFDTGFPVDFSALRRQLGPAVRILGGPHIELLRTSTPQQVRQEVRRIMHSGVRQGGMFVLREGNNLAPHTPLENIDALYCAGREFGTDS